jgi:hypothetical protein
MGLINIMIPIPHTVLDEGGWRMWGTIQTKLKFTQIFPQFPESRSYKRFLKILQTKQT